MSNGLKRFNTNVKTFSNFINMKFGAIAVQSQRGCLMGFLVLTGFSSMALIVKGVFDEDPARHISVSQIKIPTDIYMNQNPDQDQLIMLGKLKGEIDGEFEAFYLAVDRNGQLYTNHNLRLSEQPFVRSAGWETISRKQLEFYEKRLHFLPLRGKSLTH